LIVTASSLELTVILGLDQLLRYQLTPGLHHSFFDAE